MRARTLAAFVEALRDASLRVSTAEHLLAAECLMALPDLERAHVKAALRGALISRADDRATFDRVFDAFFILPEATGRGGDDDAQRSEEDRSGRRGDGDGGPGKRPRDGSPKPNTELEKQPPKPLDKNNKDSTPKPRVEHEERPTQDEPDAESARAALELDLGIDLRGVKAAALTRDLTGYLSPEAQIESVAAIARVLEELAPVWSRRARRDRRGGRLDIKRLFRRNIRHGGVPVTLPWRRRAQQPPRLALLCDVSGSVRSMAGLLLRLCLGLERCFDACRIALFVDRPVEVAPERLRALLPDATSLEPVVMRRRGLRRAPSWGWRAVGLEGVDRHALSDFGSTFYHLERDSPGFVDGRTLFVVLGDGRTNHFDPMPWAFEALAQRAAWTLWLVPEERRRWNTGDSALSAWEGACDAMLETTTLRSLLGALRQLMVAAQSSVRQP